MRMMDSLQSSVLLRNLAGLPRSEGAADQTPRCPTNTAVGRCSPASQQKASAVESSWF